MSELTFAESHDDGYHCWSVRGPAGGVHIWAKIAVMPFRSEKYYGGVETHLPATAESHDHEDCWLLGGPCHHDGSSLYFSEVIQPAIRDRDINALMPFMAPILSSFYNSKCRGPADDSN